MTNNTKKEPSKPVDLIDELRAMMPTRTLRTWEHLATAEHQAGRLHDKLKQTGPAADLGWVTQLETIKIVLVPRWKMEGLSGMTTWQDDHWLIGINRGNPHARRRFTLCHEFKHALDANRDRLTYKGITTAQREYIADYFAACYLMPKLWVRRAWTSDIQDPEALAGLFGVSRQAMDKRLKYFGFVDDEPERPVATYFRLASDHYPVAS
jgi:Zn-dependent peptidase ImmA (M78 family)